MARILVVDDEPGVRGMLRQTFERAGYQVVEAANGAAAQRMFSELGAIDVIITDILMPEQDGLEFIVGLRKQHPEVKIVAVSGGGGSGQLDLLPAAKHLGAARTFKKPFDRKELVQAIGEILGETPQENG